MTTLLDDVMLHPAANLLPMMSGPELDELAADIAEHGLQEPVVWFNGQLLDGRNRVAAIELIPDQQLRKELQARVTEPKNGKILPSDVDPYAYVVSANAHRRHLTSEQKPAAITALLKSNPARSDRLTAKIAKVSHPTVSAVRRDLEEAGDVEKLSTRTDTKGRHQPASKLERVVAQSPTLYRDSVIAGFATVLRARLRGALDDLVRLLGNEQARIETLPMRVRVELAQGFLRVLNVGIDDLQSPQTLAAE